MPGVWGEAGAKAAEEGAVETDTLSGPRSGASMNHADMY